MKKMMIGQVKMVLEWREREHEDMDRLAMGDTHEFTCSTEVRVAKILSHIKTESPSLTFRDIGALMGP